jgi:Kef-type K+ transport system membrane component KefB
MASLRRLALGIALALVLPGVGESAEGAGHPHFGPLLFAVAVLVLAAKVGGILAERTGQPAVLGELVAGIGLGNLAFLVPGMEELGKTRLGMLARGEVGLIFAGIGAGLTLDGAPILGRDLFSAIVLVVLVTTLLAPVGLRVVFARVRTSRDAGTAP